MPIILNLKNILFSAWLGIMACLGGAVLSIILLVLVNLCGTVFVEAVNYKSCKYEILAIIKKFLEKWKKKNIKNCDFIRLLCFFGDQ